MSTVDDYDYGFRHNDCYEFCHHDPQKPTEKELDPYSEDGYCCWCGNGSWKSHMPHCEWADIHDPE